LPAEMRRGRDARAPRRVGYPRCEQLRSEGKALLPRRKDPAPGGAGGRVTVFRFDRSTCVATYWYRGRVVRLNLCCDVVPGRGCDVVLERCCDVVLRRCCDVGLGRGYGARQRLSPTSRKNSDERSGWDVC